MENELKKLIKEVLEKGYLMSLATLDDGGVWVSDVIYIFDDDLNIYWMSNPDVRHSVAIMKNPKVAGVITSNGPKEDNLGIQFEGIAEKINGKRYDLIIKHFAKRKKSVPTEAEAENILQSNSFYMLRPQKIELIYERLFGFNKQKLIFN